MEKNTTEAVQKLKAERVQEELAAAGEPRGMDVPLVISLKAERVQEPASAAVPAARGKTVCFIELTVNPYERVNINRPALQAHITLERPVAGAAWSAGLVEAG